MEVAGAPRLTKEKKLATYLLELIAMFEFRLFHSKTSIAICFVRSFELSMPW